MKQCWRALVLLPFLLSCTKKAEVPSQSLTTKELVVGTDAAYAPFESENSDKTIVGFDIDIIHAVAAKANLQIRIINTPWEGLFSQLASGDRDILISAITINEDRKKAMDFSQPYFEAVQLIALPMNSTVSNLTDLKTLMVGVQTGTTGDEIVSGLLGKNSSNIKRFEGTPLALQELINGGVDAVVADNGVIDNFLANNAKIFKTVSDPVFKKEYYGIAVKKENSELLAKINAGLEEIKKDGTYQKIFDKYFNKKSP